MFLKLRQKTQGAVAIATTIAAFANGACSDSTAGTDLRPEGPPDVLAVLVLNDSVGGLVEAATYCKHGDPKRPGLVGLPDFTTTTLCPVDLNEDPEMATDASPDTFYVRIMFDELLNPGIETLDPILDDNGLETGSFTGSLRDSLPVTLKCKGVDNAMHELAYDGYYSPSGNAVTWPVGPSLVIKPARNVTVPTNSDCEVSIKPGVVFDKQGIEVPADQLGPFKFKINPIKALAVDPSDSGDPAEPTAVDAFSIYFDNAYTQFNTEVLTTSVCTDDGLGMALFGVPPTFGAMCRSNMPVAFDIAPHVTGGCSNNLAPCTMDADCGAAGRTCDFFYALNLFPFGFSRQEFAFGPIYPIKSDSDYTFSYNQGAMLKDRCGITTTLGAPDPDALTSVKFHTNKFDLKKTSISINNNDKPAPNRKPRFPFTNVVDLTTIDTATEISIDPLPFFDATTPIDPAADYPDSSNEGDIFFPGFYKPDTDYTVTIKGGSKFSDAYGAEYTHPADTVIKFHTQPIALTASSPATGATITKALPTSITTITFTFNQDMDPTTFDASDIELTGAATTLSFSAGTTGSTNCSYRSTGCQLRVRGVYTPGDYTLKLKKDAVIKDKLGNDYVQAADRVIKFTIKEAPPATPVPCLGS